MLVARVVDEARVSAVLPIEPSKYQDGRWADLVSHREIARDPRGLIADVDSFPNILLNIVCLADIRNLLWRELDSTGENVNELGIKDATSSTVSSHVELCHSDPLIDANVVVLTSFVEVLSIVAANDIDAILL